MFSQLETAMQHFTSTGGFLTVKADNSVNTMTVSWGFIGFLWGKPYFITVVRPQRYTRELIDKADSYTISIPYATMKQELSLCGTKSGRNINKGEIVTFLPSKSVGSPIVGGCDMYYECKIRYTVPMDGDKMPDFINEKFYKGDFHDFYFGEIVEGYCK